MLLTIDIGNTTVAVGGFLGPELRFVRRLPSDRNMDAAACAARMRTLLAEEGAALQDVEGAVLSSVVPSLTQVAVQAAEALTRRPGPGAGAGSRPRPAHRETMTSPTWAWTGWWTRGRPGPVAAPSGGL